MAELLTKALGSSTFDTPDLTAADRQALRALLRDEGDLGSGGLYRGSGRRGYQTPPGTEPGQLSEPYDRGELLQSTLGHYLALDVEFDYQAPMFQVVGGTDRLAAAFADELGERIEYEAVVQEIRKTAAGVRIVYTAADGTTQAIEGDYGLCTIPLPVLAAIPADFSSQMQRAIGAVSYTPAGKLGLQFSRRFWEEDEGIYGGITRTNLDISRIWYPSSDYLTEKGIVVGYYDVGSNARRTGAMSPVERADWALEQGRQIHAQYDDAFETAFSVPWHKVPYTMGAWAGYSDSARRNAYPILAQADDRLYLAGEHISYLNGWMAGAFESAQQAVTLIHDHARHV
jgi:monoamine oxidase